MAAVRHDYRAPARPAKPGRGTLQGRRLHKPGTAGAILFELVVSLAIFLAASAFTLRATGDVLRRIDRAQREHLALDIAASRLAELEAGLIQLADIRAGDLRTIGSRREAFDELDDESLSIRWTVEADTQRSDFAGLSLVTLTVREAEEVAGDDAVVVTLRQLLPLTDEQIEAYEMDELLEDLPEDGGER